MPVLINSNFRVMIQRNNDFSRSRNGTSGISEQTVSYSEVLRDSLIDDLITSEVPVFWKRVHNTIYTVHKYYFLEDGGTCPARCTLRYSVQTEGQTGDMQARNLQLCSILLCPPEPPL